MPVFFLDLQTTGSQPAQSDILEFAWASQEPESLESYLVETTNNYVPRFIRELTGLTESDLLEAKPLNKVMMQFREFLKSTGATVPAVIHYSRFEKPFLDKAFLQDDEALPFDIFCTHKIAKRLFPNLPTRSIKGLAGYYGYVKNDLKRSAHHVEATRFIWNELLHDLEAAGILSFEDLKTFLTEPQKTKRTKYEYPLAKEKRLALPDQPGVYRMISKTSEILYVGKATSLKERVNSYFRGKKGRDPRKLEMLTQVWDLVVTPLDTPLEAALLESDEIKKHNPRYNIKYKTGQRKMIFYNSEFTDGQAFQDETYFNGPFSSIWILDSVIKLSQSLRDSKSDLPQNRIKLNPLLFFDPVNEDILQSGYLLFCQRHHFNPFEFTSVRHILAVGAYWSRQNAEIVDEITLNEVEHETTDLTAEDIADKFKRHFIRAAQAYLRARKMTGLLNSVVSFETTDGDLKRTLQFQQGLLSEVRFSPISKLKWQNLEIDTFDRMSILASELMRLPKHQRSVQLL